MPKEYTEQIAAAAEHHLKSSQRGIAYIAVEQGGYQKDKDSSFIIAASVQDKITRVTDIADLAADLRASVFARAQQNELTDSSKKHPTDTVIANQSEFVDVLLGSNPQILTKLAGVQARIQVFKEVISSRPVITETQKDLALKISAWEHTITSLAQHFCPDPKSQQDFHNLVNTNIEILSRPKTITTKDSKGHPMQVMHKSYKERLGMLLAIPRTERSIISGVRPARGEQLAEKLVDEFLETAYTLNAVRVLDRIQRPLAPDASFGKLFNCLTETESDSRYQQFIERNNLKVEFQEFKKVQIEARKSNLSTDEKEEKLKALEKSFQEKLRPALEAFAQEIEDEPVDLIETRRSITKIHQQAQEVRSSQQDKTKQEKQLQSLDKQLEDLLVPIANKVARLFPHQSSTNLTEVLNNEEAVCAGKVNVLLVVSQYLGLNSRAVSVRELLDGRPDGHVVFETDLPSGKKLVIDANFVNKPNILKRTENEVREKILKEEPDIDEKELASEVWYYQFAFGNSRAIRNDSRVLLYTVEKIIGKVTTTQSLFLKINPYTGQGETWKASVPYPHLIVMPDRDGFTYINSSFCNNTAMFIRLGYADVALYLLKKQIDLNPYDLRAQTAYAGYLENDQAIRYLEDLMRAKPSLFWDGLYDDLAKSYIQKGDFTKANALYKQLQAKDPELYSQNIYKLAKAYKLQSYRDSSKEAELLAEAREVLNKAKNEDAQLFYSQTDNTYMLYKLYDNDIDAQIGIVEDMLTQHPQIFWRQNKVGVYESHFDLLLNLYTSKLVYGPACLTKLEPLFQQAKQFDVQAYIKNLHRLTLGYDLRSEEGQQKALTLLEDAKSTDIANFLENRNNITSLARLYTNLEEPEKAIALYQQVQQYNPQLFWNHDPLYHELARIYGDNNQIDKAIALGEEAKEKSRGFWQEGYSSGYVKLVELYTQANHLDKALELSLEAEAKSDKFYCPDFEEDGYIQLAGIYMQLGQADKAVEVLIKGKESDKNFWKNDRGEPTASKLAVAYTRTRQFQPAIDIYHQLRNLNPVDFWKHDYYKITDVLEKAGQAEAAQKLRNELINKYENLRSERTPVDHNNYWHHAMMKLALLYIEVNNTSQAIVILEEGKTEYRNFPMRGRELLIDAYLKGGNKEKAAENYKLIIDLYTKTGNLNYIPKVLTRARSQGIKLSSI